MRQRLLKSLRIAVTAVSLLVCGLLSVLWVRFYDNLELIVLEFPTSRKASAASFHGVLALGLGRTNNQGNHWHFYRETHNGELLSIPTWSIPTTKQSYAVTAPHWFYLTIFTTIAALPWIKWRFSLRTLLIVVTLFAVFFGAIAISL